jgi:hypothetical protein
MIEDDAVPKSAYGTTLQLSHLTRRAFQKVLKTRTEKGFLKAAKTFIRHLNDDVWTCPHHVGFSRNKTCECGGVGWISRLLGAVGRKVLSALTTSKGTKPNTLSSSWTLYFLDWSL